MADGSRACALVRLLVLPPNETISELHLRSRSETALILLIRSAEHKAKRTVVVSGVDGLARTMNDHGGVQTCIVHDLTGPGKPKNGTLMISV